MTLSQRFVMLASSTKGLKLKIGLRQGYTINKENTRIPEPQFL